MRNRLGPLASKSRWNAQSSHDFESSRPMCCVPEVELVLAVDVGQIDVIEHPPLRLHLRVQRRARHRRVQHELVAVGVVRDGVLDLGADVVGRVVLQADDGRALHADAVRLQLARQRERVGVLQLGVARSRRLEPHPHPGDAELDELPHVVPADGVGRREDEHRPGLAVLLHHVEQLERPLLVQEEVLVHHEERSARRSWRSALHMTSNSSAPGFVEVHELALAAEERRGRAEVAAHRAADRRDDRRGRIAAAARRLEAHQAEAERRRDRRMRDRRVDRLAEEARGTSGCPRP